MDFDDTAWCSVCDRAIRRNRYIERIPPPPPGASQSILEETTSPRTDVTTTVIKRPTGFYFCHIDLRPTPLYCSRDCQIADSHHDQLAGSSSRPVDANAHPSPVECSPPTSPTSASLAKLASHSDLAPPPAPIDHGSSEVKAPSGNDFLGGVIMAGRRMRLELLNPNRLNLEQRRPIPGWTDGTNAWRDATYNLSTKTPTSTFTARSCSGIPSTLSRSFIRPLPHRPVRCAPMDVTESNAELLSRFSRSFVRKEFHTSNIASDSSSPPPLAASSTSNKEKTTLSTQTDGNILASKVSPQSTNSSRSSSLKSSALSRLAEPKGDVGDLQSSFFDKKLKLETRPWSYDGVWTYPVMKTPSEKVKRKEKKVVDGVEVEVEVEVTEERKRLFLFAPVTTVRV